MTRDEIVTLLRSHSVEIRERFGVKRLAVFGSTVRDAARADSDIDVLVEFEGDPTFDGYWSVKEFLEALLDREVDLVTDDAVRPQLRPYIEKDLVDVA
jgi:uncharacterized protein